VGSYYQAVVVKIIFIVFYVSLPAVYRIAQARILPTDCEWILSYYFADLNLLVRERLVLRNSLDPLKIGALFKEVSQIHLFLL